MSHHPRLLALLLACWFVDMSAQAAIGLEAAQSSQPSPRDSPLVALLREGYFVFAPGGLGSSRQLTSSAHDPSIDDIATVGLFWDCRFTSVLAVRALLDTGV